MIMPRLNPARMLVNSGQCLPGISALQLDNAASPRHKPFKKKRLLNIRWFGAPLALVLTERPQRGARTQKPPGFARAQFVAKERANVRIRCF